MLVKDRIIISLRSSIALTLVALGLVVGYVLGQAFPSTEGVRLRNALVIEGGRPATFAWTPETMPRSFMAESHESYFWLLEAVRLIGGTDDWSKALALAGSLSRKVLDRGQIEADLLSTYQEIVQEGRGYCADFIDVYVALAHAAGLTPRQWAFSFDGFGGHGHTIVEIYDRQRKKWVFLDVYNNIHAVDPATGAPLSALEFRDFALGLRAAEIRPNGPGRLGYVIEAKLIQYYRDGANEWYMWWGNNVYTYDSHPFVRAAGGIWRKLEPGAAILAGVHPRMKVLRTAENTRAYRRMIYLRWSLLVSAALAAALAVALCVQVALLVFRRRRLAHQREVRSDVAARTS